MTPVARLDMEEGMIQKRHCRNFIDVNIWLSLIIYNGNRKVRLIILFFFCCFLIRFEMILL